MTARSSPDRRRRLLPWALVVAAAILGATILAALTADGDPEPADSPAQAAPTTLPSITAGLAADDPAPEFSADTFDGSTFRLSEHQATDGRPVLLNLWASWCFPCREEMPAIDAVASRHPEVFFVGVAVDDDPVAAAAFAEEIGVSYLLAIDETGVVTSHYPTLGLPATFLISAEGRVVAKLFGGATEATFEEFLGFLDG